ncbi:uncharacterized protein LOC112556500 isoform X5 [Pomacea canaliculata]|uniref:uncharacterized protein LOC112556500 isoform X5 n=1 Tax=Pomacea canaliculata TaxID=400727 RepID=UPI000D732B44|nr:uncharacterized protein LOC112556500 isoform X5 [Pomacea canaliculata]
MVNFLADFRYCYPVEYTWKREFGLEVRHKKLTEGAVPSIQKHEKSRPTRAEYYMGPQTRSSEPTSAPSKSVSTNNSTVTTPCISGPITVPSRSPYHTRTRVTSSDFMMGRRGGGSPGSYGLRRRGSEPVSGIELMMECYDDALTPSQVIASKRARDEYRKAIRMIEAAKAGKLIGPEGQTLPTEPQAVKVVNDTGCSPDIIIVGETPPSHTKARKRLQISPVSSPTTPAAPPPPPPPPISLSAQLPPPPSLQHVGPALPQTQTRPQMLAANSHLVGPVIPAGAIPQQVFRFVNYGQTAGANVPQNNQWVLRPIMPVMPQQVQKGPLPPVQQASPPASAQMPCIVSGTSGLGIKRPPDMPDSPSPPAKRQRKRTHTETDGSGNWVPLDEYYYGKMEGDPTYSEEKGEHRFKCWVCTKMLYNNIKAMMHLQGHIDSEKQQTLDLSDLTQCRHCYKQFDTPFEMQTHIEKVHMNNVNVLMCRICEKDHETRSALTTHMRQNHCACEMPYVCQLCNFRSSMYSDVVDHFKKKHDSSDNLLCLYCLRVFRVKFVSQGWGQTQVYYHHLLRHQSKTNNRKCTFCKLSFFSPQDLKTHRKMHHLPNQKGIIGANAKYSATDLVMIKVPESGLQPKKSSMLKSLNAPAVSKVTEHRGLRMPPQISTVYCFECKMLMSTPDHYKKYIQCSMCRFATSCSFAYAAHMMSFHSGQSTSVADNVPWERFLQSPLFCACGFASRYGNKIANHLVFCSKRTCSVVKPEILALDKQSEEEQKDPRHKPDASILDVLGLVKKQCISSSSSSSSEGEEPANREDIAEEQQDRDAVNVKIRTIRRQRRDPGRNGFGPASSKGPQVKEQMMLFPAEQDSDITNSDSVSHQEQHGESSVSIPGQDQLQQPNASSKTTDNREVCCSPQRVDHKDEPTACKSSPGGIEEEEVLTSRKCDGDDPATEISSETLSVAGKSGRGSHVEDSIEDDHGEGTTRDGDVKGEASDEEIKWDESDDEVSILSDAHEVGSKTDDQKLKQGNSDAEPLLQTPQTDDEDIDFVQEQNSNSSDNAELQPEVQDGSKAMEGECSELSMGDSSQEEESCEKDDEQSFLETVANQDGQNTAKDQGMMDQTEMKIEEVDSYSHQSQHETEHFQEKLSATEKSPCTEDTSDQEKPCTTDNQSKKSHWEDKETDISQEGGSLSGLADEASSLEDVPLASGKAEEEEGDQKENISLEELQGSHWSENVVETVKSHDTSKDCGDRVEEAKPSDNTQDNQPTSVYRLDTKEESSELDKSRILEAEEASKERSSETQSYPHCESHHTHERHFSRESDGRERSHDRWRDHQSMHADRRDRDRDTGGNYGRDRYDRDRSYDRQQYPDWQRDRHYDQRYDSHRGRNHYQHGGYQHRDRNHDHNRYRGHGNQGRHSYQDHSHRRYY